MNKLLQSAGLFLLIVVLVFSLAACGLRTVTESPVESATPTVEPTKEVVVETAPPSPTPTPTPTPTVSVPPVAVTTVPMPMPSVSPTVAVTNQPVATDSAGNPVATAAVSPSPSVSPSPTPTPYSYDAAFASSIMPDSVTIPDSAEDGYLNSNGVNLRGGPSMSARVLGTYDSGTYAAILGTENGWTEVIINGDVGYVRSEYVNRGYVGSNAASYSSSGATAYVVSDGTGSAGLVIVPDGSINSNTSNTVTTPVNDGLDIFGGVPIG